MYKSFFVSYNTRTSYNPSLTYQYPQDGVASRPAIDLMRFHKMIGSKASGFALFQIASHFS